MPSRPILVAGATGYVGGRLVPLLLGQGRRVRALTRSVRKIRSRPWGEHENLEIVQGDMHDLASVSRALEGCGTIYYLVHSMEAKYEDFSDADRRAAYTLVKALKGRHDMRVIYLSGLLPDDAALSKHLRSRGEVELILSLADAPLTTLRAAQLVGAGSASFEMIRYLVDRLPVMLTPKWTRVKTQPIAVSDALAYLTGVLDAPQSSGKSYDIGGPDILSYADLFAMYAEEAGLRRCIVSVPWWSSLRFSSHFVSLVTPIPAALAKPLIEGMRNEVVCHDNSIRSVVPIELTPIRAAIKRALGSVRKQHIRTSWFDAGLPPVPEWVIKGDPAYAGAAVYNDAYSVRLAATAEEVWKPIAAIGGATGWYSNPFLWRIRGLMDKMAGGPGLQRGRRSAEELFVGDGLDFWRVLDIKVNRRLLLFTEMRLPGEGLLDLKVLPVASGPVASAEEGGATSKICAGEGECAGGEMAVTDLVLSLYMRPRGLPGVLYWHAVSPFHRFVFIKMLKTISERVGRPVLSGPKRITYPLSDPVE